MINNYYCKPGELENFNPKWKTKDEGIEKTVLDECDQIKEIPMIGKKQSLNVSVATGIALFALSGKSGKM